MTMIMKILFPLLAVLLFPVQMIKADEFDLSHRAWTELLGKHVVLMDQGRASRVAYAALQADSGRLQNYLAVLSRVTAREFAAWDKRDRLAFLINAMPTMHLR